MLSNIIKEITKTKDKNKKLENIKKLEIMRDKATIQLMEEYNIEKINKLKDIICKISIVIIRVELDLIEGGDF